MSALFVALNLAVSRYGIPDVDKIAKNGMNWKSSSLLKISNMVAFEPICSEKYSQLSISQPMKIKDNMSWEVTF